MDLGRQERQRGGLLLDPCPGGRLRVAPSLVTTGAQSTQGGSSHRTGRCPGSVRRELRAAKAPGASTAAASNEPSAQGPYPHPTLPAPRDTLPFPLRDKQLSGEERISPSKKKFHGHVCSRRNNGGHIRRATMGGQAQRHRAYSSETRRYVCGEGLRSRAGGPLAGAGPDM